MSRVRLGSPLAKTIVSGHIEPHAEMKNITPAKMSETLTISNYKTKVATNAATFKFNKKMVPAGTEVVDLR